MVAVDIGDKHDVTLRRHGVVVRADRIDLDDPIGVLDLKARVLDGRDLNIPAGSREHIGLQAAGPALRKTTADNATDASSTKT